MNPSRSSSPRHAPNVRALTSHASLVLGVALSLLMLACDGNIDVSQNGEPSGEPGTLTDQGGTHTPRDQGTSGVSDMGKDADPNTPKDQGTQSDSDTPREEMGVDEEMGSGPTPHPNQLSQEELFTCKGVAASTPARLRRIDNMEWSRSIADGAGQLVPLFPGPSDQYSTYTSTETIDASILREYLRSNHIPNGSWAVDNNNGSPRLKILRGANSINDKIRCVQRDYTGKARQDSPTDACIDSFVRAYLEHGVYFRPPNDGEVARLSAFARKQFDKEVDHAAERDKTLEKIVRAAWMTRGALFHDELGQGDVQPDGRRKLSNMELAQSLSLAIGDHIAGVSRAGYVNEEGEDNRHLQAMYEAAEAGVLDDPANIEAQARWHLGGVEPAMTDPNAHPSSYPVGWNSFEDRYWMSPKLRGFFQEWLGYGDVVNVFKDTPEATAAFGPNSFIRQLYSGENNSTFSGRHRRRHDIAYNNAALASMLDNTIARVLAEDQDTIANLLTTRRFLVKSTGSDPYAGAVYNINITESGEVNTLEERWYTFPQNERAGILTHPAWLAAHGGNFENDPSLIHRGKWIRENLLCGFLPAIPLNVNAMLDPDSKDQSARNRVTDATENDPYCAGCHALMNPLGKPFEIYNHAGYWRIEDHGAPPDGSATVLALPEDGVLTSQLQVNDAVQMMERFAQSPHVKRCVIRQSFRYFMGRDETMRDACTLSQMEQAYDGSGGSFIAMLVALFQSDSFLFRHDDSQVMP